MAIKSIPVKSATVAENIRGSILMMLAMAGFGINDIVTKYISSSLDIGQMTLIRGIFAIIFIWVLAKLTGKLRPVRTAFQPLLMLRGVAEVLATLTFLMALYNIPIANTTAVLQALPLTVTLGAALFFGESIGWRRMLAIGAGFIGVLLIVRPGMEGFSIYSISVLGTVFFAAIRDLATRNVSENIPSLFIALIPAVLVTLMGAALTLYQGWKEVDLVTVGWLAFAAAFIVIGYSCIAASMRVGDISFTVPFRYTILLYAIFAGIIFFDEIPDTLTIIGSTIIVGSGLYTVHRERLRHRTKT